MKKFTKPILMATLSIFLMVSLFACYGNFALTRKLYQWNGSITGNKYINNFAFWALCIIPAYELASSIDFIVLNTIEFWTGSNPMAMNEGEAKIQYAEIDGIQYKLMMTKDTISIEDLSGAKPTKTLDLGFDEATQSWYLNQDGESIKIASIKGDTAEFFYPNGNSLSMELNY